MNDINLQITAIPAFQDNYIWLLETGGDACAVVDPGDAGPVFESLQARDLQLRYILLTHHHWDHAGGVPDLLDHYPATVFGPVDDRLDDWCMPCREGDRIDLDEMALQFRVLDVPAHTRSHIAFFGHGVLFSGDTLFSMGCGRLFEGTPQQMLEAMDKFSALPPDTKVYCGHEYTESNCRFALQVEPENPVLRDKARRVAEARRQHRITLPGVLGEELDANPFMRSREPEVISAAQTREPAARSGAEVLGVIRAWKDAS